jgi:hypothetical protein
MFCYHYGVNSAITFNAYKVIPPVMWNFGIL